MKMKCIAKLPPITEALRHWCGEEFDTETLVRLPVEPPFGAMPQQCATNVEIACSMFGGKLAEGWLLWNNYGAMVASEHHVAWESPSGGLIDLTPQDGFSHVLFADTGRRFVLDTEECSSFFSRWNAVHPDGPESNPYLLTIEHPKVEQLAADLHATQVAMSRYRNGRLFAGKSPDDALTDRYWDRIDSICQKMEDFTKWKPKDTKTVRAKKKAERKRKRNQRRLCRR